MRVLVCGGRDFSSFKAVCDGLNLHAHEAELLILGGSRGADSLAQEWAEHHHIPCVIFSPEWEKYGKAAGPIRNQQMIDQGQPDLVVAFPGGRGTEDMIRRAKTVGLTVIEP